MATTEILLAGFGGQGILFAGKILAYCGLMDNKELSRVYGYLQRRGFSYGVIKEAVADLAEKGI